MSQNDPCEICQNLNRDNKTICVVSETKDLLAIEKTNEYNGVYHVLQGVISPLEGIGANDIRIRELLNRISGNDVEEIIKLANFSTSRLGIFSKCNAILWADFGPIEGNRSKKSIRLANGFVYCMG